MEDARTLFDRALGPDARPGWLTARALLARARALEAAGLTRLMDIEEALHLAHDSGDLRLEMAAELARGGDVTVALGRPVAECAEHLAAGLGWRPGWRTVRPRRVQQPAHRARDQPPSFRPGAGPRPAA